MTNFENITKDNIPIKLSCENCGTIAEFKTDEFEIIEGLNRYTFMDYFGINEDIRKRHSHCCNVNGKPTYYRVVVRRK